MQLPRVIPCLLLQHKGLVKTVRFNSPRYIGDPINAVKIYNEMEADELIFLDILASRTGSGIDWETVEEIANEAFMPVCYGGGITTVAQAERLFRIGIEKVSLSTAAAIQPQLISDIATRFGSQSVVVTLDVKRFGNDLMIVTHSGTRPTGRKLSAALDVAIAQGAGEIMVNSVDRDGTMEGYDIELISQATQAVKVPVIACGGCGSIDDLRVAATEGGASAVAAGSIFVYWGRLNGILINYPRRSTLKQIFQ